MDKLLEFLSHNVIEEKMYWRVAQLYTERQYEIQWSRDGEHPWKLRPVNEGSSMPAVMPPSIGSAVAACVRPVQVPC